MSSGRLLEPGGNVRSRWMAIRVETHDRTRGMWGLVNFQDPPLRRVLLYPAAVGTSVYQVSVYRISVYRVSGRIGQHTFRRRRSCSSQTVHHTFCRRSQAIQSRHNLLPTPTTPSASAEAEGFSVRRRMLTMPTCMASMQVQPENRGSQRNPTARANHPRACARTILVRDPLHMRRSSCATVLVRNRPHTDSWSCIRFHRALFFVRDRPHTRRPPLACIRHQSQIERRDEHADSYDAPRHAHHLDHVKIHDETRSPRAAMPGHAVSWRIRASRL